MKAISALYEAQKIIFSPFIFQAVYSMSELGILDALNNSKSGLSFVEISEQTNVSKYGVTVLVEMAESAGIVDEIAPGKFLLSKIGYFILRDEMTQVNMKFTQDVCYNGLFFLKDAITDGSPKGLKVFGDWKTVYEGLSKLPTEVKKSWFDFDHFYSDNSFSDALPIIFKNRPKLIFDIGGNTGKWAIASTNFDSDVQVKIFDLPGQLSVAKATIEKNDTIKDRISFQEIDVLNPTSVIPGGADVYWMSQFLDCFSEYEIESILLKIKANASPNSTIYIMETFLDNQVFPAAKLSLAATSLYFTAIANGNSRMYSSRTLKYIIEKAGLKCVNEHNLHQDSFHTILEVKLA